MAALFLASSTTEAASWLYTRPAFGRTGRVVTENNFTKERRSWIAILLREVLQNGLDARAKESEPVTIRIAEKSLLETDADFIDQLITKEHLARFKKSVPHIKEQLTAVRRFLILEDFGTTGLIGETTDPELDGKGQNWNAFWFREGEGSKEHGSGNGGAGQGKITYFSTSSIRTIFAYTVRSDDNSQALFGASSFLRDYEFNSVKCLRDSYYGIRQNVNESIIAVPTSNIDHIQAFKNNFGLLRQSDQPGLSLVIPSPKEFSTKDAIEIIIAEFFTPILRGDLIITIEDTTLDKTTVMSIADAILTDDRARELHTCTTTGYRLFLKLALEKSRLNEVESVTGVELVSQLSEASFNPESLARLRDTLESEGQVAVRFPITLKPRGDKQISSHFDVHLMYPEGLDKAEQAIVRRDLLIGEEPLGGGSLRQKARGLTLVNDHELSKLLLSAEEPTHLRWNASLPRLNEYYKSGGDVVSFVRNAMAKLLEVLTGGDQKRDFKLLAKFFAAPGANSNIPAKGKKSKQGDKTDVPVDIPPPKPKKLVLQALADGCKVFSNPSYKLELTELPIQASLEFAYEGLDKDAFAEYDPLDFDLVDSSFKIITANSSVTSRNLNTIEFEVTEADFRFEVTGFDINLRLRVRLNYEEASDDKAIDSE